jgi:membrane protease YdiL (CAAX protease family)
LTFSQRGLGLLPVELSDGLAFLCYFLSTYAGPFLAAFVVTYAVDGSPGIRKLLKRVVQWRVGWQWYVILLPGYPLLVLGGVAFLSGGVSLGQLLNGWPLIFSSYLPAILFGLLFPSLGEETGWRGFALGRLQHRYGPVIGSLSLGILHALWHLPAYPVRGLFTEVGWDTTVFIANSLAIITATLVWTWLFNNARGSIFFAILIHATSNATSGIVSAWLPGLAEDPWLLAKIFGATALVLILATRGRLAYVQDVKESIG